MEPIYKNFDGLEISFQGAIPEYILRELRVAKEIAQQNRCMSPTKLNAGTFLVMVAETGMRGGYAFRFDTGEDGETWFIADSMKRDRWNIRVSVKSLNLAIRGYTETKNKILDILYNKLEAVGINTEGLLSGLLKERVSRFDFCVDFKTENFEPSEKNIISHSKSTKAFNVINNSNSLEYTARGRVVESVRIGKMPNRQLAIYNKTKEIISNRKKYWWKLWGINSDEFKGQIWRIEIRAGKKELNSWNIKTFKDFETKAGDVALDILNNIRYVIPNENDLNPARWANYEFWNELIKVSKKNLFNYISKVERGELMQGIREEKIIVFEKQLSGSFISFMALQDKNLDQLPGEIELMIVSMFHDKGINKKKILEKYKKAWEKYKLLE
jgi:hypothetical protein